MRHFIDLSTEELEELYNHLHAELSMTWLKEKLARHISCYNLEFNYGKQDEPVSTDCKSKTEKDLP